MPPHEDKCGIAEKVGLFGCGPQGNSPAQESKKVCFLGCCSIGVEFEFVEELACAVRAGTAAPQKEANPNNQTQPNNLT